MMDNENIGSCAEREPYALRVMGNSMEPEFPDNCIIIIDPTPYCEHGNYVFVETSDEERWLRQFVVKGDKQYLVAGNKEYPDIELPAGSFKIHGVVVQKNVKREVTHYDYERDSQVTAAQT
ncbi:MAG: S24 family peptidase [Methylococcales bacterium]|jgi:SOS-response transcriptional repressor LexA|nr:S24 family peptidase [Methylococcales bacterium]MBT7446019.1 S24 family peptidase [Methylococcales bacterium]